MVVVVSYKAPWQLMTGRYLGTCRTYQTCLGAYLGTYQVGNSICQIQVLSALGPTSVTRLVVGLKALLAYEFIPLDFLLFAMLTSVGGSNILFVRISACCSASLCL